MPPLLPKAIACALVCFAAVSSLGAPTSAPPISTPSASAPLQGQLLEDPTATKEADRRRTEDLELQRRGVQAAEVQALAAERQVQIAWVALVLSALGAVGLLFSLKFSRDSVTYAQDAASAARSALSADRAWLFLQYAGRHGLKARADGRSFDLQELDMRITNHGRTPALHPRITVFDLYWTGNRDVIEPGAGGAPFVQSTYLTIKDISVDEPLLPEKSVTLARRFTYERTDVPHQRAADDADDVVPAYLMLHCVIEYDDVYGEHHETSFFQRVTDRRISTPLPRGQEAKYNYRR